MGDNQLTEIMSIGLRLLLRPFAVSVSFRLEHFWPFAPQYHQILY